MTDSTSNGITALNADLFSAAAYDAKGTPVSLPSEWHEDVSLSKETNASTGFSTDTNRFRVFVNDDTHQIVFAFKGSNSWQNFESDLLNDGYAAYTEIHADANDSYTSIKSDPAYSSISGYQIITTGHSLGGGMAQSFALEHNLDGFGQNSLPIANETLSDINKSISDYHNTFIETNVDGDVATWYYAKNDTDLSHYLDKNPTTLASPYGAIEQAEAQAAQVATLEGLSFAGVVADTAIVATGALAHRLGYFHSLLSDYSIGADGHLVSSNQNTGTTGQSTVSTENNDTTATAVQDNGTQINTVTSFSSEESKAILDAISSGQTLPADTQVYVDNSLASDGSTQVNSFGWENADGSGGYFVNHEDTGIMQTFGFDANGHTTSIETEGQLGTSREDIPSSVKFTYYADGALRMVVTLETSENSYTAYQSYSTQKVFCYDESGTLTGMYEQYLVVYPNGGTEYRVVRPVGVPDVDSNAPADPLAEAAILDQAAAWGHPLTEDLANVATDSENAAIWATSNGSASWNVVPGVNDTKGNYESFVALANDESLFIVSPYSSPPGVEDDYGFSQYIWAGGISENSAFIQKVYDHGTILTPIYSPYLYTNGNYQATFYHLTGYKSVAQDGTVTADTVEDDGSKHHVVTEPDGTAVSDIIYVDGSSSHGVINPDHTGTYQKIDVSGNVLESDTWTTTGYSGRQNSADGSYVTYVSDSSASTTYQQYNYNASNQLTGEIVKHADGSDASYAFDANGRETLDLIHNADGSIVQHVYTYHDDGSYTLKVISEAAGESTTGTVIYDYAADQQLVSEEVTNTDGSTVDYTFNENGQVATVDQNNADGSTLDKTYTYYDDGSYQLTVVSAGADATASTTVEYGYNANQQLVFESLTLADGSNELDSYENGVLKTTDIYEVATGISVHGVYTYSATDPSYTLTTQSTPPAGGSTTAEYDYDAHQILAREHIVEPDGSMQTNTFSESGALLTADAYTAGTGETVHNVYNYSSTDLSYTLLTQTTSAAGVTITTEYDYNTNHHLVGKQTTQADGSTIDYTYNDGGQVLTMDQHTSATDVSIHDAYSYTSSDGSYDVTEGIQSADGVLTSTVYSYDKNGNLQAQGSGSAVGIYSESHFDNLGITRTIKLDADKHRLQDTWSMAIRSTNQKGEWFGSDTYNADGSGVGTIASDTSWTGSAFSGVVRISADGTSVATATDALGDSVVINMDRNGNWLSDSASLADGSVITDTYGTGYSDTRTYQHTDGSHGVEQYNSSGQLVAWHYYDAAGHEDVGSAQGTSYTDTTTTASDDTYTIEADTGHLDSLGIRVIDTQTIKTYDGSGGALLSEQTIDNINDATTIKTYAADGSYVEVDTDRDGDVLTANYDSQGQFNGGSFHTGFGDVSLDSGANTTFLTTYSGDPAEFTFGADGTKDLFISYSSGETLETVWNAGGLQKASETFTVADGSFSATRSNWQWQPYGESWSEVDVTKNFFGEGSTDVVYYNVDWIPTSDDPNFTTDTILKEVVTLQDGSTDTTVYNADGSTHEVITQTLYDEDSIFNFYHNYYSEDIVDGTETIDTQPDGSYSIRWENSQGDKAYAKYDAATQTGYRSEVLADGAWQAAALSYSAGLEAYTNPVMMSDNYVAGYMIDGGGNVIRNVSSSSVSALDPLAALPFEITYTPPVISSDTGDPTPPGSKLGWGGTSASNGGSGGGGQGGLGTTTIVYSDGSITVPNGMDTSNLTLIHSSIGLIPGYSVSLQTTSVFTGGSGLSIEGDPQLVLTLGDGNRIVITDFDPTDPFGSSTVQQFEFGDGTTISLKGLFKEVGTGGNGIVNNPDGSVSSYTIDPSGDVPYSARTIAADGRTTASFRLASDGSTERDTWAYNSDGTVTQTQVTTAADATASSTYVTTTDASGQLLERDVTNDDSSTEHDTWNYNFDGSVSETQVYADAGSETPSTYVTTIDATGRLLERDVASANGSTEQDTWTHNSDNTTTEARTFTDTTGATTSYVSTNDTTGRLIERDIANADGSIELDTWTYSSDGTPTETQVFVPPGGSNVLQATGPDQTVTGSSNGPVTLIGGYANDVLIGASGQDTFEYNVGSGAETIEETAAITASSNNTLQLGNGITPDMLTLSIVAGSQLVLTIGSNGDSVTIDNFNPLDPLNSIAIQHFVFADGTSLSLSQLLAQVNATESGGDLFNDDGSFMEYDFTPSGDRLYGASAYNLNSQITNRYEVYADGSSDSTTYVYNVDNQLTDIFVSNGDGSAEHDSYNYNADGSSTTTQMFTDASGDVLGTDIYTYDAQGNTVSAEHDYPDGGVQPRTTIQRHIKPQAQSGATLTARRKWTPSRRMRMAIP